MKGSTTHVHALEHQRPEELRRRPATSYSPTTPGRSSSYSRTRLEPGTVSRSPQREVARERSQSWLERRVALADSRAAEAPARAAKRAAAAPDALEEAMKAQNAKLESLRAQGGRSSMTPPGDAEQALNTLTRPSLKFPQF